MKCFSCFVLFAILFSSGCQRKEYSSGKDTLESFGNGRFQLFRGNSGRTLADVKEQDTLLLNSGSWQEDGNHVYAYGDKGVFVIADLKTETYSKYNKIDDVPIEYREKVSALHKVK